MTDYIDTYVARADKDALEAFASNFANHITLAQGRSPVEATEDAPAQDAVGDPALWYTCVRATFDITPLIASPFEKASDEIGSVVCGVWARELGAF